MIRKQFNNPFLFNCYDNERQQLEKYIKKLVKNEDATVTYIQATKNCRVFPNYLLGLISIRREIRHTLASDKYVDINVENCHPVLLSKICNHNKIEHKYLKRYINNRAE